MPAPKSAPSMIAALLLVMLAGAAVEAGDAVPGDLLVTDPDGNTVFRFDSNGFFIDEFIENPVLDAREILFGPDGHLYVVSAEEGSVIRFHGTTGAFLDVFVEAGAGGLDFAFGAAFDELGRLYVISNGTNEVLRYESDGAFLDVFATESLDAPIDLCFGPSGDLYVTDLEDVIRFDGTTGEFVSFFAVGGALNVGSGLTFGPDGHLYVSDLVGFAVHRYDGQTGFFLDQFVEPSSGGLATPFGLVFGPDGHLYVCSSGTDNVLRYAGDDGSFIDEFAGGNGLELPTFLTFVEPPAFIRGDADGDGTFNGLVDALFILEHQFGGGPAGPCFEAMDGDDSGDFNGLVDGLYLLQHQFQGGPPPPPPYPDCGTDSAAGLGCLGQGATGCP